MIQYTIRWILYHDILHCNMTHSACIAGFWRTGSPGRRGSASRQPSARPPAVHLIITIIRFIISIPIIIIITIEVMYTYLSLSLSIYLSLSLYIHIYIYNCDYDWHLRQAARESGTQRPGRSCLTLIYRVVEYIHMIS